MVVRTNQASNNNLETPEKWGPLGLITATDTPGTVLKLDLLKLDDWKCKI